MISEKIEGIKQVVSANNESKLDDQRAGGQLEEQFAQVESFLTGDTEPVQDPLQLYFSQAAQTPLLDAREEQLLGGRIEEGEYLSKVEQDWIIHHGTRPSPIDLLLSLGDRLSRADSQFDITCQYLGLRVAEPVGKKMPDIALRHVIDGNIEPGLTRAVAKATGVGERRARHDLIQLSLNSRLTPWHLLGEAAQKRTLTEFGEVLCSSEFGQWLQSYHFEISRHFQQTRESSSQAIDHLTRANLRLVIAVARRYSGRGMALLDLIQEGNIGLLHATRKFDHRRGYKFSTYATWWIRQSITRAIADQSRTIRLPVHIVEIGMKLNKARQRLCQEYGRSPTNEELASEIGVSPQKLDWLLKAYSREPVSLAAPVGEEGEESELADFIGDENASAPEDQAMNSMFRERLMNVLGSSLSPREKRIIELRFGLRDGRPHTLEEVGQSLGVTRERIRQIERQALSKLRHPSQSRKLLAYLG